MEFKTIDQKMNKTIRIILAKPPPSAVFTSPQMVLKLQLCHEGSDYVFSFEIGQGEGGFYSARTDTHTHTHTQNQRQTDGQSHPVPY